MITKTDISEIQNYLVDASNFQGNCEAVYFPETKEDIIAILRDANISGKKVTIVGNRTGLTGGCVPVGGIVISMDKMNKILQINESEMYAIVEPGVMLREFLDEVSERNLYYPPDPTEKDCFISGNVANNASGAKTFKYGPTRDYVQGLVIILPTGEEIKLQRGQVFADGYKLNLTTVSGNKIEISLPKYTMPKTKHAAGYYVKENMDAIDLFIGSEGTLGLIVEISLRLLPKPENVLSAVIFFKSEEEGLSFIESARSVSIQNRNNQNKDGIDALGLEYFDGNALRFLKEDFPNVPDIAEAAIWFEQEFSAENEESIFEKWVELIEECNGDVDLAWFANNDKERSQFTDFRHAVSSKVNEYVSRNNILKVGTDIAVPDENFDKFYFAAKKLVAESNIDQLAYGHFGDSHLHLNMLPKNQDEYKIAKEIYAELCKMGVELKGTISAEHGIGKLKRDYLLTMYGEDTIREMANLKKQLDPNLILNIGNIIDQKFYEN